MALLDISQVAKQSGLPASALRYYEEQGLITSAGRRGLKRLFEPNVLVKLAFISLGKAAGFSLDTIAAMIGGDGQPSIPRDTLHARADELEQQIHRLSKLRDAIRHVADCPHPSHMECPKFIRLLTMGLKHQAKQSSKRRSAPSRRAA